MPDFSKLLSSVAPIALGAAGTALGGPIGGMVGGQLGKMLGGSMNGGGAQSMAQQAGSMGQALGAAQINQGSNSKAQANSLFPQYEDPRQLALLTEIQQKRKSLETGADFSDQIQNADQAQAGTQAGIVKSTGGDTGATIQGLLQSERNTGGIRNQAFANGQQQQANYNNIYTGLLNGISSRKLELQLQKSQQKMAEWAQSTQNGNQNFLTGAAQNLHEPDLTVQPDSGTNFGQMLNDMQNSNLGNLGQTDTVPMSGIIPELTDLSAAA